MTDLIAKATSNEGVWQIFINSLHSANGIAAPALAWCKPGGFAHKRSRLRMGDLNA